MHNDNVARKRNSLREVLVVTLYFRLGYSLAPSERKWWERHVDNPFPTRIASADLSNYPQRVKRQLGQ